MSAIAEHELRQQQTKRHHLNLLIQGAAMEATLDIDVDELRPFPKGDELAIMTDWVAVSMQLSTYEARSYLLCGWTGGDPQRFWGSIDRPSNPFTHSALLRNHALDLVELGYDYAKDRAISIGMSQSSTKRHDRQLLESIRHLHALESRTRAELETLAATVVSADWGIPAQRLHPKLTEKVDPGPMLDGQETPSGFRGRLTSLCTAGWSRVVFAVDKPAQVEAAGFVYPLLIHELVKGTAELAAAHGLGSLTDEMYAAVIAATDKIEYERWALQVGPALFRLWEQTLPASVGPAAGLAHVALAEPDVVETLLMAVVEDTEAASQIMRHLCADSITER